MVAPRNIIKKYFIRFILYQLIYGVNLLLQLPTTDLAMIALWIRSFVWRVLKFKYSSNFHLSCNATM